MQKHVNKTEQKKDAGKNIMGPHFPERLAHSIQLPERSGWKPKKHKMHTKAVFPAYTNMRLTPTRKKRKKQKEKVRVLDEDHGKSVSAMITTDEAMSSQREKTKKGADKKIGTAGEYQAHRMHLQTDR